MTFNGTILFNNLLGHNIKKYLMIVPFLLFVTNAFSEEIINSDFTLVYRMNNDNDVQIVFDFIKTWIARNNHYNCTIRNAEEGNENAEIFLIEKPVTRFNYTSYQCIFYSKGKRINLILSDNEILGLTTPYSSNEREQVFERFYQLYRWNVLGIYP